MATIGKRGGRATAAQRTPEERKEAARKAAAARWGKSKKGDALPPLDAL